MDWNEPQRKGSVVVQESKSPPGYIITAAKGEHDPEKLIFVCGVDNHDHGPEFFCRLTGFSAQDVPAARAAWAALRVVCGAHAQKAKKEEAPGG